MFSKGDIVFYKHINANQQSRAKMGPRSWVILHTYTHPLKTYLIAPITRTSGYQPTQVELEKSKYTDILNTTSYIDLRSITVANEEFLRVQKGIDNNGKNTIQLPEKPTLQPEDIIKTDLAIIMAFELGATIQGVVENEKNKYIEEVKSEVSRKIDMLMKKIDVALDNIQDTEVKNLIKSLVEEFKKQL